MTVLSIDFETRSTVELPDTGVYPYAKHPTTDVWCMAWAFDDEEPQIWAPTVHVGGGYGWNPDPLSLPARVVDHVRAGGEVRAWNMNFERTIWGAIMVPRYGAPPLHMEQAFCTMAEAAAMALPLKLERCALILGVAEQKDMDGSALCKRMCRPRRYEADGTPVWWDVPAKLEQLYAYCRQDVKTERALYHALRRLTPAEREVYLLDQRINDRGITVDTALVQAASKIVTVGIERAENELFELTGGAVDGCMNWNAQRLWINSQGVATDSVDRATRTELLARDDLPPLVRRVLTLIDDAGQTSVAKLPALLSYADPEDGRARGMFQYHAAGTGRWGGRGPQPQNFKRPEMDGDPEQYIPLVLSGDYDLVNLAAPPITVVTDLLRSMLTAAPGHDLIAADFAAVEAVVLNWLAGQEDMLALFRQYFAGDKTKDPYIQNAMRFYGLPFEAIKKHPHRQMGKFQELGCGFGMGHKKGVDTAKSIYGLTIAEEESKSAVDDYRARHPMVTRFWYDANDAVIAAVRDPGTTHTFGGLHNVKATKRGGYLYIVLPSGRPLCYARPRIVEEPPPWGGEPREGVQFEGLLPMGKQWGAIRLYGGLIVENIVQGVARDLIAEGMLRAEAAGYIALGSVHDEAIAEVPHGFGSVEEYEALLATPPAWAAGCPIKAEGWKNARYKK